MRKPWVFLVALWYIGYVLSTQCPSKLPTSCVCDNSEAGFRVLCSQSPNLNEILNSLKDDTVDKLDIRNCEPKVKQLVIVPSIKVRSLTISNCGIEALGGSAFNNMGNTLEELRLFNNFLTILPYMGLLPKLQSINFNNNSLTGISEQCFNGATQIRQIRAENNKICLLLTNALNEVKNNLEVLDLSGNCLTAVPLNLRNAFKLTHLDLSENKIDELAQLSFTNLPALKELRLTSNGIKALSTVAFANIPALTQLYVKDNKISKVDPNFFLSFKDLDSVDLSDNEIITIPSFKNMSNLRNVILDHNQIRRIESLTFSSCPNLEMISLQNNDISHIARNGFESLGKLRNLFLANNSLVSFDNEAFTGMNDLQHLNLRNNVLVELKNGSLAQVSNLQIADFAHNEINHIQPGTFDKQANLIWLDLSYNNITRLEQGTFDRRIPNIILDGNKLLCDDKFDWFVNYVTKNQVQTAVVGSDIKCDGPSKFAGVPIKELTVKKANDSFTQSMNTLGFGANPAMAAASGNMLASVLPALLAGGNAGGQAGGFLGAIPLLRNFPGMGFIPDGPGGMNPELNYAVERFSDPLVRFATGSKPVPGDIQQMMSTLPRLIVNIPGVGDLDLVKMNPQILEHVLRGGQIPGIPREALDIVVRRFAQNMYDAALRARSGTSIEGDDKYLPPLNSFPPEVIRLLVDGKGIPYWDAAQTRVIQDFYTAQLPLIYNHGRNNTNANNPKSNFTMFNLLPPGYNLSKIPPEVINQILHGELPDFTKLPSDIIDYLRENGENIMNSFNLPPSIEETLRKLPARVVETDTTTPYDINKIDGDLVEKEEGWLTSTRVRIISGVVVGLLAAISLGILGGYLYYLRRKRLNDQTIIFPPDEFQDNRKGGLFADGFHPSKSSILRFDADTSQPYLRTSPRRNRQESANSTSRSEAAQNTALSRTLNTTISRL